MKRRWFIIGFIAAGALGLCSLAVLKSGRLWSSQVILPGFSQPAEEPTVNRGAVVIAYHPLAREIGRQVLDSGGNAFDAFVAVTAAEYVLAEGATSLAGALGALIYDARKGEVRYLDADFNDPKDPRATWTAEDPKPGKAILPPGAVAGLEAISKQYGRRSFAEMLQPAIGLARDGFSVNNVFPIFVNYRADVLKSSEYGRRTFFPNGRALVAGDRLRQPELATFLTRLARDGSAYMYTGDWARELVKVVNEKGGFLTAEDMSTYRPAWVEPWKAIYRGYEIHASSARSYGGPWVLTALKTLEHTTPTAESHYSGSAAGLELMVRTAREVWSEPWLFDFRQLDDRALVQSRLAADYTERIWRRVDGRVSSQPQKQSGSHSYQVIVIDREGNMVNGTHTHMSDLWGTGIFIEGIPLNAAGMIPWSTRPGERRLSPFSIHLAFRDGKLRLATGAISSSFVEAEFQFLINLIDYGLPVKEAVSLPRFGTFPISSKKSNPYGLDWSRNWLDPRVDARIVKILKRRGLQFEQRGIVDTGLGAVATITPDGLIEATVAPAPYVSAPFEVPVNLRN